MSVTLINLFSRVTLLSLTLVATMGSTFVIQTTERSMIKFSEIIKNDDPRYIAVLGTGTCVTLAGLMVMYKGLVSQEVTEKGKYPILEDISSAVSRAIKCGVGVALTTAGILVIVNSKNIPGYYEATGQMPAEYAARFPF